MPSKLVMQVDLKDRNQVMQTLRWDMGGKIQTIVISNSADPERVR